MISMDKEYTTRDGRPVRVLCVDKKNTEYPVLALVTDGHDSELVEAYTAGGRYYFSKESRYDLIEKPKTRKITVWVNIYEGGIMYCYMLEKDAIRCSIGKSVKRIKMEQDVEV